MIDLDSLAKNNPTAYLILNNLNSLSNEIKEKINFIYESRLDFKHFEQFNLLLTSLHRFRLKNTMNDDKFKENLSNYINKLQKDLDSLIKYISDDKDNSSYAHRNDITAKFLEVMSLIAEFKSLRSEDGKNVDLGYCKNLLQKINEITNDSADDDNNVNSNLTESQVEILKNSKEAISAYINELETIDSSEETEDFNESIDFNESTESIESTANKAKA